MIIRPYGGLGPIGYLRLFEDGCDIDLDTDTDFLLGWKNSFSFWVFD